MSERVEAYAGWLVANKDKQGTPEFDTVANAYKELRAGTTTQPQSQPAEPEVQQEDIYAPKYTKDRDMGEDVGIGVDLTQQNLYELAGRVADAVGSEGGREWADEGKAAQDEDLAEYDFKRGDNTSILTDVVAGGGSLLAGTAAVPLLAAGSVPAAVAGGGLLATSAALNFAANAADNPDKTSGELAVETMVDTALDAAPIPVLKGTKALAKASAPGKAIQRYRKADLEKQLASLSSTKKLPKGDRRDAIFKHIDGRGQLDDLTLDEENYLNAIKGMKKNGDIKGEITQTKVKAAMNKLKMKEVAQGIKEDAMAHPIKTAAEGAFWSSALGGPSVLGPLGL